MKFECASSMHPIALCVFLGSGYRLGQFPQIVPGRQGGLSGRRIGIRWQCELAEFRDFELLPTDANENSRSAVSGPLCGREFRHDLVVDRPIVAPPIEMSCQAPSERGAEK